MNTTLTPSARQIRHIRAEDQGGGFVRGIFSTMDVDAHNTVLIPTGCDYSMYMNNSRAVNWQHGRGRRDGVPVARTESIGIEDGKLVGTIKFAADEFSQSIYNSFREGMTRGFSVEIYSRKGGSGPPRKEEIRAFPGWKNVETIYRAWQLMGLAVTPSPSNANAVAIEVRSAHEYDYDRWLLEALRSESLDKTGHLDTTRLSRSLVKHADLLLITAGRQWLQQEGDPHARR